MSLCPGRLLSIVQACKCNSKLRPWPSLHSLYEIGQACSMGPLAVAEEKQSVNGGHRLGPSERNDKVNRIKSC